MASETKAQSPDMDVSAGSIQRSPLRIFLFDNRRALSALAILIVLLSLFTLANPSVFGNPITYRSILTTLPISIFLAVPLVFIVTGGEIDLAFPSTMGFAAWMFTLAFDAGWDPFVALGAAVITGLILGTINGVLVVYANLSSLVATLGMNFLLRGLINIGAQGYSLAIPDLRGTFFHNMFAGRMIEMIPNQMYWALLFMLLGWFLYNRHIFGSRVHCVGDNPDSSAEMGINVRRTRVMLFMFVGIGAALAGVFSVLINFVWWPTTGDGFLLPGLAGIFVGGTPSWGGVGTVVGGMLGATIVSIIETGVIAAGLTGFYTQFFYGLVIILSLIGHRFNGRRYR
jgi:ribose/xylose/arabinose/galactoside ABC-type transport system permease subunit